jgi:hypothetical protein
LGHATPPLQLLASGPRRGVRQTCFWRDARRQPARSVVLLVCHGASTSSAAATVRGGGTRLEGRCTRTSS